MSQAVSIPAASAVLCESCGYTLTGVDPTRACPECGNPISQSRAELRHAPAWENRAHPGDSRRSVIGAWADTSANALFRPKRFFRHLSVPGDPAKSRRFRLTQHAIVAVVLGVATALHGGRFGFFGGLIELPTDPAFPLVALGLAVVVMALLTVGTWLTVRLTVFEAGYRGLRLPRDVVGRALDYHAVHLLPPAALGLLLAAAYAWTDARDPMLAATYVVYYLYALAGGVVVGACYLFKTYWTAMRSLMYANREG